jgi:hypothetical protein
MTWGLFGRQRQRDAGKIGPTMIDVFCEKGFFDREQTRRILEVRVVVAHCRSCRRPAVHCAARYCHVTSVAGSAAMWRPVVIVTWLSAVPRGVQAGSRLGLLGNFHGDELNPMQCGELGAETRARCISHLEHVSGALVSSLQLVTMTRVA